MQSTPTDTKKVFWKCGACSHTFFYLLDREFGRPIGTEEERASDPLAGGLLQTGHQCGMLWGSALAVGAEAYRRCEDPKEAVAVAVQATQEVMDSFVETTGTTDCRDITGTDFSKPLQMLRYLLFRARGCFNLAEEWAPAAFEAARAGLEGELDKMDEPPVSCASEVARRVGATEEEQVTVAGLAGGMGLSGRGCGALGAAVWLKSLAWIREHPGKNAMSNPEAKQLLRDFQEVTGGELLCENICGRRFESLAAHSEFIKEGGCAEVMGVLEGGEVRSL